MTLRLSGDSPAPTDYLEATATEDYHRTLANAASVRRGEALVRMHNSGMSYAKIAEATGLSRSRVQQLVERSR